MNSTFPYKLFMLLPFSLADLSPRVKSVRVKITSHVPALTDSCKQLNLD